MTNKSLARGTCDPRALCGISRSFPLLSPSQRQIAHALLTRPPLTRPRRASSVRLECVMHAASVHPEPGSNSRKICIYTRLPLGASALRFSPRTNLFSELLKSSFTLLSSVPFRNSRDFFHTNVLCTFSIVVQFLRTVRAPFFSGASVVYHSAPPLSTLFLKFF